MIQSALGIITNRRPFSAAAVYACLTPALLAAQQPPPALDEIFAWATPDAPGCVLAVAQHGRLVAHRAFGAADLERDVALSTDSRFDVGSLRKQFIAAAVLMLVEEKRLALHGDVREHFPELPAYGHTITVDHLLTHTSGIRDWTGMLGLTGDNVDVLPLILRQRSLEFAPGSEWSYSNSGYVLLKELVERVSGTPFAEFASRRMFTPLGMAGTAYHEDLEAVIEDRALAYAKTGDGWKLDMLTGNRRGGGGALLSTAADLVRWDDALTDGRLGEFVTTRLHEPAKLNNGRRLRYARGLIVDDATGLGAVVHTGGAGGYSSWLGRFPQHGLSIALLCNTDAMGTSRLANRVVDLFLPAEALAAEEERTSRGPVALDGVDVAARAGLFFPEGAGRELRLVADGNRLRIGRGQLVAVAEDRFRIARPDLFLFSQDDFELRFASEDLIELKSMEGAITRYRRAQPWSPGEEDLQEFVGRYESEEIPSVIEVVPGRGGLAMRLPLAPSQVLPLRAAAPDVFEAGRMLLRFRRGEDGRVTAFAYSNPLIHGVEYVRTGGVRVHETPRERIAPASGGPEDRAAPTVGLAELAGDYEGPGGRRVAVTVEGGKLYGEPAGNRKRELAHESRNTFTVLGAPSAIAVTFVLGEDGRPTAMVMRQGGAERRFTKIR